VEPGEPIGADRPVQPRDARLQQHGDTGRAAPCSPHNRPTATKRAPASVGIVGLSAHHMTLTNPSTAAAAAATITGPI
jgi:hypothetical protein